MKINTTDVRVAMLKRGITSTDLQRKFGVGKAAVSLALSGKRKHLLEKIATYVKSA